MLFRYLLVVTKRKYNNCNSCETKSKDFVSIASRRSPLTSFRAALQSKRQERHLYLRCNTCLRLSRAAGKTKATIFALKWARVCLTRARKRWRRLFSRKNEWSASETTFRAAGFQRVLDPLARFLGYFFDVCQRSNIQKPAHRAREAGRGRGRSIKKTGNKGCQNDSKW